MKLRSIKDRKSRKLQLSVQNDKGKLLSQSEEVTPESVKQIVNSIDWRQSHSISIADGAFKLLWVEYLLPNEGFLACFENEADEISYFEDLKTVQDVMELLFVFINSEEQMLKAYDFKQKGV